MAMAAETVPLGVLLRREVTSERMERPDVLCGEAARSRKGEDLTLLLAQAGQRVAGDPSTSFSVFAVLHCPLRPLPLPTRVQNVLESPARNWAPAGRRHGGHFFFCHYLEATPVVLCMIDARPPCTFFSVAFRRAATLDKNYFPANILLGVYLNLKK
jgi:hypothetical protein